MRKYFLLSLALSLSALVMTADTAQAQRFSGGRGGTAGRLSSPGFYGGSYGSGYYGPGILGTGYGSGILNQGYYGPNYGYGNYGYGANRFGPATYGWNSYYGPSYSPSYGSTYYPDTFMPAVPVDSHIQQAQHSPPANTAQIRVLVPDPMAKVWFDGTLMQQTGTERIYGTPDLAQGSNYSYRIRASWMQNGKEMTQEQAVSVTPGQTSTVNFR